MSTDGGSMDAKNLVQRLVNALDFAKFDGIKTRDMLLILQLRNEAHAFVNEAEALPPDDNSTATE